MEADTQLPPSLLGPRGGGQWSGRREGQGWGRRQQGEHQQQGRQGRQEVDEHQHQQQEWQQEGHEVQHQHQQQKQKQKEKQQQQLQGQRRRMQERQGQRRVDCLVAPAKRQLGDYRCPSAPAATGSGNVEGQGGVGPGVGKVWTRKLVEEVMAVRYGPVLYHHPLEKYFLEVG